MWRGRGLLTHKWDIGGRHILSPRLRIHQAGDKSKRTGTSITDVCKSLTSYTAASWVSQILCNHSIRRKFWKGQWSKLDWPRFISETVSLNGTFQDLQRVEKVNQEYFMPRGIANLLVMPIPSPLVISKGFEQLACNEKLPMNLFYSLANEVSAW